MNREELAKLRKIHETKGLRLDTASGLSGTVYGSGGSETEPVTMLLDECARSFDKDAEITKLTSQLDEARARIECAMSEIPIWRPIETAPKDGTHILVVAAGATHQPPTAAHWFDGGWHLSVNALGEFSEHGMKWVTHWQPLLWNANMAQRYSPS